MSDIQLKCTECKHSFRTFGSFIWFGFGKHSLYCRKSYSGPTTEFDPVVGEIKVKAKYENCSIARIGSGKFTLLNDNQCGEDGRFWEPKYKSGLFKLIIKESA